MTGLRINFLTTVRLHMQENRVGRTHINCRRCGINKRKSKSKVKTGRPRLKFVVNPHPPPPEELTFGTHFAKFDQIRLHGEVQELLETETHASLAARGIVVLKVRKRAP